MYAHRGKTAKGEVLSNQHFTLCIFSFFWRRRTLHQRQLFANIETGAAQQILYG
jgi:hypothetical protein